MSKPYVLLIDDDHDVLGTLSRALTREGYEVKYATSGKDGIRLIKQQIPDLLILDVMMPGMDGIELCRVIRTRQDTNGTPILILSARGDAESIMRGIEAGANDYLPKPILHHDLVAKVRMMLGQTDQVA